MLKYIRWVVSPLVDTTIHAVAWVLVKTCSQTRAYDAAIAINRWTQPICGLLQLIAISLTNRDRRYPLLKRMFSAMTRSGGVSLRVRVRNEEALIRTYRNHGRLILCTAHFGLTMAIFRALEERNLEAISISFGGNGQVDGWHWGCQKRLRLIKPGPSALFQARKALEAGTILIAYLDHAVSKIRPIWSKSVTMGISPNIFEFAQLSSIPILFFSSELAPDGAIVLDFVEPSRALTNDDRGAVVESMAQEFKDFVQARTGWQCVIQRPRLSPRAIMAKANHNPVLR